eukprot:s4559_g5.t1
MASTVVLKERGEVLPRESEESAEVPVHRDKRRADDQLQGTAFRQRGEVLPRFDPCAAHGNAPMLVTRGELLPQDAKALETDSETEQETPGLSSLTSAATPWQRRVKKREKREPDRGSEAREPSRGSAEVLSQPAVLHGMASIRGVPRDILSSLPKELAYEWQEGPTGGLAGTRLVFLARGGDTMVFEAEEMLLKLSSVTQYWEVKFSQMLPKITAKTHWQERVQIRLHQADGEVVHSHNMFMSCQDKVLLASELLGARGTSFAFHFLAYVGCLLTYVTPEATSLWLKKRDRCASSAFHTLFLSQVRSIRASIGTEMGEDDRDVQRIVKKRADEVSGRCCPAWISAVC